jgi:hypothetical protein
VRALYHLAPAGAKAANTGKPARQRASGAATP